MVNRALTPEVEVQLCAEHSCYRAVPAIAEQSTLIFLPGFPPKFQLNFNFNPICSDLHNAFKFTWMCKKILLKKKMVKK